MDEMKIGTMFMKNMVSKVTNKVLKKKLGYDICVQLNDFNAKITNGKAHVHLNIDAEMDQEDLAKVLKTIGLG